MLQVFVARCYTVPVVKATVALKANRGDFEINCCQACVFSMFGWLTTEGEWEPRRCAGSELI